MLALLLALLVFLLLLPNTVDVGGRTSQSFRLSFSALLSVCVTVPVCVCVSASICFEGFTVPVAVASPSSGVTKR